MVTLPADAAVQKSNQPQGPPFSMTSVTVEEVMRRQQDADLPAAPLAAPPPRSEDEVAMDASAGVAGRGGQ